MRSKKRYIVLLLILIIFAVVMFFLFAKDNLKEEKEATTLIVGNTSVWKYSSRRWLNVTNPTTIDSINWMNFEVYEEGKHLGNYSVWNDGSEWYYFKENKDSIKPTGKVLAYKSNFEIKVKEFSEEQIDQSDIKYIDYVLEENELSTSSLFTSSFKVNIDYDSDGEEETFYVLSNAFPTEFIPEQIFSLVFMVKDNSIYYLYNSIDENRSNNGCRPYFNYFLDLTNDGIDEIILSCGQYSTKGTIDMLYKFVDDEFKIQISNQ